MAKNFNKSRFQKLAEIESTERGKGKFVKGAGKTFDKEKEPSELDVTKTEKDLQNNTPLLAKLKLICDKEELANLILAIIVYTNPGFEKNKSAVSSALFSLRNRYKSPKDVKEDINPSSDLKTTSSNLAGYVAYGSDYKAGSDDGPGEFLSKTINDPEQLKQLQKTTADIKKVTDILDDYGVLKNKLKTINTKEEFTQLILRVILPNVCKQLKENPGAIKSALIIAANKYKDTLSEIKNIIHKSNILNEVESKDKEYLAYAIATNLAKYGTPRTPKGIKKSKLYKPTIKKRDKIAKELLKKLEEYFTLQEEKQKMCKRGKAYMGARKRAGEKSSAYLSGRGVKVCKGQIKGTDSKKTKSYNEDIIREYIQESLKNWFEKEDWVRIDTQGNITDKCGTMPKGKATQRCLPRAKAQSLTKAERKATATKKVRGSKKGKQFVKNTKKAKVTLNK